jgi:hypothetical protein
VGLTIDALPDGTAGRVKIYFRSDCVGLDWLQGWYEAAGCCKHTSLMRQFLELFPLTGQHRYPTRSFTVGLEFHPSTDVISLKTDLAITKWMASDAQLTHSAVAMVHALGSDARLPDAYLSAVGALPASDENVRSFRFVGLGHEPDGSSHLNIYLSPVEVRTVPPGCRRLKRSLAESVQDGVAFLLDARRGDCWGDFELPVGVSNSWVTAYTLARLGMVDEDVLPGYSASVLARSLDWLESVRSIRGGWGYNPSVDDDADSTSWAIMALRCHRREVPEEALRLIRSCRTPDGWFATYPMGGRNARGWHHAAPDVTAAAMRALGETWTPAAESRFRSLQRDDGSIPAYWWASRFYTAALLAEGYPRNCLSALFGGAVDLWHHALAANAFELAQLLSIHARVGNPRQASSIASEICARQRSDGSWPSSAILRLPTCELRTPWEAIDGGRLFSDLNRVFTTATTVAALSMFAGVERGYR